MSEPEGFTVRTALMRPDHRTALLRATVELVRADVAAVRCGLSADPTQVGAAVAVLEEAGGRDDADPDLVRTRMIAGPSPAVLDAVASVVPVALHATLWDDEANLLLDVINGDRFWVRVTPEEIESLVEGCRDVKVVPDGDWVPGTASRAKRAWGRRTKSRFRG